MQRRSRGLSFGVMAPEMAGAVRRCGGGRTCLVRRCARDVLVRSECRDVQTTRDHTVSGGLVAAAETLAESLMMRGAHRRRRDRKQAG